MGAVRVIRDDRPAALRSAAMDRPIVRSGRGDVLDDLAELIDLAPPLGLGERRREPLLGEGDARQGELEDVERLDLDGGKIDALGRFARRRRIEIGAQEIRRLIGARKHVGAQHLGDGVAREAMASHAHHILRPPARRARAERDEFGREHLGLALGQSHIGVDAAGEGLADFAHIAAAIGGPFALHIATEKKSRAARSCIRKPGPKSADSKPSPRFRQKSICHKRSRAALKPWAKKRSARFWAAI